MMAHSPYTSPPLPIPSLKDLNHNATSNNTELTDILDTLPEEIGLWNYTQVTSFIVAILNLPKFLINDIKSFIINKEINGKKLLQLDEDKLMTLGFNRLWCYHLALGIEELNVIAKVIKEEKALNTKLTYQTQKSKSNPKQLTLGHKRGSFIQEGLKKQNSFSKQKFHTINLLPPKPFSLPNVELSLLKQFMVSETIGLKSDVKKLKEQLRRTEEKKEEAMKGVSKKEEEGKGEGKGAGKESFNNTFFYSSILITTFVSFVCYYTFKINTRR
ncbi:hypothetical protein K502DRAFT_342178 [Neoconidiobolus thromboides FSU 785]|nr:hypothetical protein K502DRAFT_342178 [Neoconidiobolus thromboides FSU 785]